jgi:hypothetical protein
MTKSKQSLRNSAKLGLLKLCVILIYISGCSSSITPTYLKEDVTTAIQEICKTEYKIDVKVREFGSTLWIYRPVEDIIVKSDKPEKYVETFSIEESKGDFKEGSFYFQYNIKPIPEEEKYQDKKLNKSVLEKDNDILRALYRVLFSMEKLKRGEPQFICMATADIKNGYLFENIFYYHDFKKLFYGFISMTEFGHRNVDKRYKSDALIQDREGVNLNYRDFTLEEFVAMQILHRIDLKFGKPEVDKHADIDKEIIKVITYVIKTYGLKDFTAVQIENLLTQNRTILNRQAILTRSAE